MDPQPLIGSVNKNRQISIEGTISSSSLKKMQLRQKKSLAYSDSDSEQDHHNQLQNIKHHQDDNLLISNLVVYSIPDIMHFLLQSVQSSEILEVRSLLHHLRDQGQPSLQNIRDAKFQTLLHIVCFNNHPSLLQSLLSYEMEVSKTVVAWVGVQNNETFTAVHFAAYRGSIRNLQILYEYGARLDVQNGQGQNAMSVAAQGDQVNVMVWLKIQGLSISERDGKGGTPLHWASYYGSEFAVNILLGWVQSMPKYPDIINIQDQDGMTALHLAAMSGNIKIVKKLLLRGADRGIKDQRGQQPGDLALENQFDNIHKMLYQSNTILEFLNLKSSFRMAEKTNVQVMTFFLLYMFCIMGTVVFCFPLAPNNWFLLLTISTISAGTLLYFLTSFIGPGHIKKQQSDTQLLELYQLHEPWEVCPECIIYKSKRSRHCEICRRCAIVYDHHCPWINNCVGARNHALFMLFIVFLWLNIIQLEFMNGYCMTTTYQHINNDLFFWFNGSTSEIIFRLKLLVQGLILIIGAIFFIPITILIYYQTNNFLLNKTTIERYKIKLLTRRASQLSLSNQVVQENTKSLSNCYTMCFMNQTNTTYDYKS